MISDDKTIIIVGGVRDFHAIDWYRAVGRVCPDREVVFVTDLFGGEGYSDLSSSDDIIFPLFVIDKILFSKQSHYSNLWRNFVKLVLIPLQAARLRQILNKFPQRVVHAHPMYYMALSMMAGVEYLGTPQGDEVLIRPTRSRIYKFFAAKLLAGAKAIIVDSLQMKDGVKKISGVEAHVFQNGINLDEIALHNTFNMRKRVYSIRGMDDLYRIAEIVEIRNKTAKSTPLTFSYPFADTNYLSRLRSLMEPQDEVLGRVEKYKLYGLLSESFLVISIPRSDSSPRSVYEAIFAGACVAVTYNRWIDVLPPCMKSRLFIVDLSDEQWFKKAMSYALELTKTPFVASQEAIEIYSENSSIGKVIEKFY